MKGREERSYKKDNPVVCFGCGLKEHRKSACSDRVARDKRPGHSHSKNLSGTIGKKAFDMDLDNGADHTVV